METALTAYPTLSEVKSIAQIYARLCCVDFSVLKPFTVFLSRFESDVFTPAKLKAVTVLAPLKR